MLLLALAGVGLIGWVEYRRLAWPQPDFVTIAKWDLALVSVFLLEFAVRLARAPNRGRFLRENWYELPGLIPLYIEAWAWLRAMRLLRITRLLRLLRTLQALQRMRRNFAVVDRVIRRSRISYTFAAAATVVAAMATSVWVLEREVNPNFREFGDALWWAVVTATTVGYGDITPQTGGARVLAGTLMLVGIGLIGVVSSSLSMALLERAPGEEGASASLADELERVAALRERGLLTDEEFAEAKKKLLG